MRIPQYFKTRTHNYQNLFLEFTFTNYNQSYEIYKKDIFLKKKKAIIYKTQ